MPHFYHKLRHLRRLVECLLATGAGWCYHPLDRGFIHAQQPLCSQTHPDHPSHYYPGHYPLLLRRAICCQPGSRAKITANFHADPQCDPDPNQHPNAYLDANPHPDRFGYLGAGHTLAYAYLDLYPNRNAHRNADPNAEPDNSSLTNRLQHPFANCHDRGSQRNLNFHPTASPKRYANPNQHTGAHFDRYLDTDSHHLTNPDRHTGPDNPLTYPEICRLLHPNYGVLLTLKKPNP